MATRPARSVHSTARECITVDFGRGDAVAIDDKKMLPATPPTRLNEVGEGSVAVVGRESPYSLCDQDLVTFEEGAVAYDHRDAAGFIRLNALRLRTLGQRKKKLKL